MYATASGGTAWAWFMSDYPPRQGAEDKTVWRLDGATVTRSPTFELLGPEGATGRLDWGPEIHAGSNWNRPGVEFGTGLMFTSPGCWDVRVSFGQLRADAFVIVV